jgi:hypothetical protein
MVEEIILLHETEYFLPVDYRSGFLQIFCELLVVIAYKFSFQEILYNKKDLCVRDTTISFHMER